MDMTENLPTTDMITPSERIIIECRYYDDEGNQTLLSNMAHRLDVTVRKSIFLIISTDIFDSEGNPTGNKTTTETETNAPNDTGNIVYGYKIEKESYQDLSLILFELLNTEIKSLSLHIDNEIPSNISLNGDLLSRIFSNYENIDLDLVGLQSWVVLPEVDSTLKYLSIKNAFLEVKQTMISIDDSFVLENTVLRSSSIISNRPSLVVTVGKESIISNVTVDNKLFISISANAAKELKTWNKTNISISNFVVDFEDTEKTSSRTNPGAINDAILTIAECNSVNIYGIKSTRDLPYFALLSIKNVNELNITEISKASKELPSYTPAVILSNCHTINISDISYTGSAKSSESLSFIRLNKSRVDSEISIMDCMLVNMGLINLTGSSLSTLAIHNSSLKSEYILYKMETSSISKLILDNVTIISDYLRIKALELSILSDTNIETKEDLSIEVLTSGNISSSLLKSINNFDIFLSHSSTLHISDSTINSFKTFKAYTRPDEEEELASRLDISRSYLDIGKGNFSNISSLTVSEGDIAGKSILVDVVSALFDANIKYGSSVLPITIQNTAIRESTLSLFNPGNKQETNIFNCKGTLNIIYQDDESPSSKHLLNLSNSRMKMHFDGVSSRRITINSDESLGSVITGESEDMILIPDITCHDKLAFEHIDGKLPNNTKEKIIYGVITE